MSSLRRSLMALVIILAVAGSALAGSTKPNAPALQKSAARLAADHDAVQKQVSALLQRLANDAAFAHDFDAAAFKGSRPELLRLIREGGVTRRVVIDAIGRDMWIRITVHGDGWSASLTISW